ncbi:DNA helicase-2/ATP-dependent DNA helicase PcrA [Conyzicola lurida]|uniref:DNA 3'-5' helicase n=1 Tax=Conyzicola lurida TaxID=1172621 RepID=A0A841AJH3_9MICO|nr:ATP-dependent helicase [Conyzicola lurida]MBB5842478.1 DNA helicase-2/ATP-dependent DNA helicase PcrA [Conyzicola lurida]
MSQTEIRSAESLLAGLDDQQRVAAETLLGPVCLLAGAGTGKTRAITHRIAYGVATGVYPPGRVMALTFTSRAAGELRSRLRHLGAAGVSARTFHASALAQLNFFWPQVVGGTMPRLIDSKARLLAQAAETIRLKLDTPTLRDTAAEIEWRKVSRLSIEQYGAAAASRNLPPALTIDKAVALQQAYENLKDERRQLDFEDVLLATAGMIETEARVAQQVREQYRFFVIDEYQDVSPLQHDLVKLWMGERNDLCVVGDASQTIYSFAGATPEYLLGFASAYDDATVVRLEQNYRSTPGIIEAANRLMKGRPGALTLHSPPETGDTVVSPAAARPPLVDGFDSDTSEARAVAKAVADEIAGGTKPEDIAILFRINVQAAAIEAALNTLGVPYLVRGATRFFELREIKEALMMFKGASVSIVGEPLFKTVSDVLRSLGWTQEAPEARGAVRDRWESLNALMGLAEQTPAGTTLKDFVDDLFERQAAQHEPTLSAVTIATLHSAKGLEWESVHLVGLSEGLVPITYAKTDEAVDEERRLLYVGITRARRKLSLSWAATGSNSGGSFRPGQRQASRFLAELQR